MSHCDSFCYRVLVAVIIIVVFYFSTSGEFWQLNIGNCFLYIIWYQFSTYCLSMKIEIFAGDGLFNAKFWFILLDQLGF